MALPRRVALAGDGPLGRRSAPRSPSSPSARAASPGARRPATRTASRPRTSRSSTPSAPATRSWPGWCRACSTTACSAAPSARDRLRAAGLADVRPAIDRALATSGLTVPPRRRLRPDPGGDPMTDFAYEDLLPLGADETPYRLLTTDGVVDVRGRRAHASSQVEPEALRLLTAEAMHDIAHYLRPAHLAAAAHDPRRPRGAAATTGSSRSTCSRTPTSPPAACCRCARTPAPRSSWAREAERVLTGGDDERGDQPRASTTPTPGSTCATRRWRR